MTPDGEDYLRPAHYPMPAGWQVIAEVSFTVAAIVTLLAAAWLSRRRGSWQPLIYTVAGGVTVVNEATLAHLSHATHSQDGAHVAWYAQGLGIPFYAVGAYVPYFGIVLLILVPLFHSRRLSPRAVWGVAGAVIAGVFLFEMPWMAAGLWHYYGRQSFQPFGWMPIWYAFASAMLTFVPAVVVARAGNRLHGLSSVLLIPIVVMSSFAGVAAVSWPMWLTMSSTWPDWTVHLAALAVVGLVALVVWLAIPAVTAPRCAADPTRKPVDHSVEGAAPL
jgi:hypothetical protein